MKQKVEQLYGSEEATIFRASNNWFRILKTRHNISLGKRTNKKKQSKQDKTYEDASSSQVWVSHPSCGLDKRQATLQLCQSAWMDSAINMEWKDKTFIPGIKDKSNESVLFADNISLQCLKEFHFRCIEKANTVVYLLPENQTDKVQPIDAGVGRMMKMKISEEMEKW
eukprot:gene17163-18885_t